MTPERQAEARRLLATMPTFLDCTDGIVWTVDGRQIDDEGNYETWQEKIAEASSDLAPFFAAAPTLLTEALDAVAAREREIARLRAWMAEYPNDKYTGAWWLQEFDRIIASERQQTGATR